MGWLRRQNKTVAQCVALLSWGVVFGACGQNQAASGGSAFVDGPEVAAAPIIGGEWCTADAYPSAVALIATAEGRTSTGNTVRLASLVCSGVLVAQDVVLTAAHCLDIERRVYETPGVDTIAFDFWVSRTPDLLQLAAQSDRTLPDDAVRAEAWLPHPEFDLRGNHDDGGRLGNRKDIALLFLEEAVDVEPALLATPEEAELLEEGAAVVLVGWGTRADPRDPVAVATALPRGHKVCADSFINLLDTYEMQLGECGNRKCYGDSGGPSFMAFRGAGGVTWRLVGISSRAFGPSQCRLGGVDTRLDGWRDWIEDQMLAACLSGARSLCEQPGLSTPAVLGEDSGEELVLTGLSDGPEVECRSLASLVQPPREGGCASVQPSSLMVGIVAFPAARWYRSRSRSLRSPIV